MDNKVIYSVFVCRGIKHKGKVMAHNYVSQYGSPVYKLNTLNIIRLRNYTLKLRLLLMSSSEEVKVKFYENYLF